MLLPKEEQELLTVFYLTVHALHDLYVTLSMENNRKQLFTRLIMTGKHPPQHHKVCSST